MRLFEEEEDSYYCLSKCILFFWMGVLDFAEFNLKNFDYDEKLKKEFLILWREGYLFLGLYCVI